MYYVYGLYSPEYKKIYVGYTSDLEKRLYFHNNSMESHYTSRFRPWIIIYYEGLPEKKEAMMREKQLKTARGRQFIKSYIPKED